MTLQQAEWVESDGGPMIMLPKAHVLKWRGSDELPGQVLTDYERACSKEGYINKICMGNYQGLVLGGLPDRMTVLRVGNRVVVVRWHYGTSEAFFLAEVERTLDQGKEIGRFAWQPEEPTYHLFDSVYPFEEVERALSVEFEMSEHIVRTFEYDGRDTIYVAHVFQRK